MAESRNHKTKDGANTFNTYARQMRAIGPAKGVWQIVPPKDQHVARIAAEHDRMANEGPAVTPVGGYPLTDHGGSTIPNPKLVIIYLGQWWADKAKIEAFAGDVMAAGYLAPLAQYGSGNGRYLASFEGPAVSGTVTDAELEQVLSGIIANPPAGFPAPDGHTLYSMFLPDDVSVTMGGSASCSGFCGYHSSLTDARTFYSVQPSTNCQGCIQGDAFSSFTAVLGHEISEACADAFPGKGWFNDETGMENADEWAWVFGPYGPWTVQGYQVNGVGNSLSIIRYAPVQTPGPPPSTQGDRAKVDAVIAQAEASLEAARSGTKSSYAKYAYRYAAKQALPWLQGMIDQVLTS